MITVTGIYDNFNINLTFKDHVLIVVGNCTSPPVYT